MEKKILQITSGRGPVECCRVVAKVQELLLNAARQSGMTATVLDQLKGDLNGTLRSATILIEGISVSAFVGEWCGSIQWIAQSPYRKFHKRKNWFAGVEAFDLDAGLQWRLSDVVFETCRASGPGGQNVNKVETAVRGRYIPSGISVLAMDSRSQLQNKKLCLDRLKTKVMAWQAAAMVAKQQSQWQQHNVLERGNPVKTFILPLL